jgi:competence protein ComEC
VYLSIALPLVALTAVALLVWIAALTQPDGKLHVYFLDVGEGDAILARSPTGSTMLIDGGPDPTTTLDQLDRHLPFWDRSIDIVVSTHPDEDHLAGLLEVVRTYDVGMVLQSGYESGSALEDAWSQILTEEKLQVNLTIEGEEIDLGGGAIASVLNPTAEVTHGSSNDNSVVMRIGYGDIAVLVTGDIGDEAERRLIRNASGLVSNVVVVPHHGASSSSSAAFLSAVKPNTAIISVGEANRFGHPSAQVLSRLASLGATVYRTDEVGTIEMSSDGRNLQLRTDRQ